MKIIDPIEKRRSLRGITKAEISPEMIKTLVKAASLAPSCYNNQPWKFIFVQEEEKLLEMRKALSKGNEWCYGAGLLIAVISKKGLDCVIRDRSYYKFDTGLAVGNLMIQAAEMGLVTHPIAGYSPEKVRSILNIPRNWKVITLIPVGKVSDTPFPGDEQRPERLPFENVYSMNEFSSDLDRKVRH